MTLTNNITTGELINGVILVATAFIVWMYTRAAQKSKEIQEKPILNLYLRKSRTGPNMAHEFKLRNVGKGPAYNINFLDIRPSNYTYYPHFNEPNPILENNGDEKPLDMWVETPDGSVESYDSISGFQFFLSRLFPRDIPQREQERRKRTSAIFVINYDGVNGKNYHSIFRFYSKLWPSLEVYDLVVEFISSGEGLCNMTTARSLCRQKETIKRFDQ